MDERDLAYVAGLIDGEGCFRLGIHYRKGDNQLVISPTLSLTLLKGVKENEDTLEWLAENFGGALCRRSGKGIEWKVSCRRLDPLLDAVIPYLRIKRREAEIIHEVRQLIKKKGARQWQPEEIKRVAELQDRLLARRTGRGLKRRWTGEEILRLYAMRMPKHQQILLAREEALRLRERGLGYHAIARRLGVTPGTAYRLVNVYTA